MASGIENVQRLREALRCAEGARDFLKQMIQNGAQGEQILEAQKQADALVSRLQRTLDDLSVTLENRLN